MTREWKMLDDLDPFAAEHTDPLEALAEDILHRITTSHGTNLDDEDFGESIFDWLSSSQDLDGMKAALTTELSKDERVAQVSVSVARVGETGDHEITIEVRTDDDELLTIERVATSDGELVAA